MNSLLKLRLRIHHVSGEAWETASVGPYLQDADRVLHVDAPAMLRVVEAAANVKWDDVCGLASLVFPDDQVEALMAVERAMIALTKEGKDGE